MDTNCKTIVKNEQKRKFRNFKTIDVDMKYEKYNKYWMNVANVFIYSRLVLPAMHL